MTVRVPTRVAVNIRVSSPVTRARNFFFFFFTLKYKSVLKSYTGCILLSGSFPQVLGVNLNGIFRYNFKNIKKGFELFKKDQSFINNVDNIYQSKGR